MNKINALIESLPFNPYSSHQPILTKMAEVVLIGEILSNPDYDIQKISKDDFSDSVYGFIFDIWLNLKKQDLPRGVEEVAMQLRHEDRVGKNGLELLGEAYLLFLVAPHYAYPGHARDSVLHSSIVRKIQCQLSKENAGSP